MWRVRASIRLILEYMLGVWNILRVRACVLDNQNMLRHDLPLPYICFRHPQDIHILIEDTTLPSV